MNPTNAEQMTPFLQDWKGIVALILIFVVAPVVTAGLPLWLKVKKIDGQVSNTHDTNLRDDLDGVKEDISDLKEIVLQGFSQVHEAINLETRQRIAGDEKRCA
ncbi:hypothetical protein ODIN_29 [Mycobacterium phage Odin]|nr:hypothetical protein ODIN_29 [Mycobacterium phage Odin]